MPKPAVAISSIRQYECLRAAGAFQEDLEIFTDNEEMFDFFKEKKINFSYLDERSFRNRWNEINSWSASAAARMIRLARQATPDGEYIFKALHFYFSTLFSQTIKNHFFAKIFLGSTKGPVYVFEDLKPWVDGRPDGNVSLNYFLARRAESSGRDVRTMACPLISEAPHKASPHLKKRFKKMIFSVYLFFRGPGAKGAYVVYGSLRHLKAAAQELKRRKKSVVIYDHDLHKDILFFAITHSIPYYLASEFESSFVPERIPEQADKMLEAARTVFLRARGSGDWMFGDLDMPDLVLGKLWPLVEKRIRGFVSHVLCYQEAASSFKARALLVDEDFSLRGFAASTFEANAVPVFCLSHSIWRTDFEVPDAYREFANSWTLVHSQEEKRSYERRGWNARRLVVTGIPRFDILKNISGTRQKAGREGVPRLLYSASYLVPHNPAELGYVGSDFFCYRSTQVASLSVLAGIAARTPFRLVIKPHYKEEEKNWEILLRSLLSDVDCDLMSADDDLYKLLAGCDVLLTASWSTTIFEAAMMGIPVFYLDFNEELSSEADSLAETGICQIFRDAGSLEAAISRLSVKTNSFSNTHGEDWLGKMDGQGTKRAVDFIEKTVYA